MDQILMLPAPSAAPPSVGQALLFSRELEVEIEKEERQGRYTLERFRELRKEAFADCVALLAAAKPGYEGMRRIGRILGVHHLTVAAVRDDIDAAKTIDTLRERLSRKCLTAAELLADRVLESPGAIPAGMIGMVLDQMIKNAELLGNRATGRVEHSERIDIYAHYEEILGELEPGDGAKQLDGDQVREIGFAGGNLATIEAATAARPGEVRIDAESADSASNALSRSPENPTLPTTDRPENEAGASPDARNEGGRGSGDSMGGGFRRSGSNKQNFSGNASRQPPPI